ncbi:MAG: Asp-tRNA(Asn)/Glu-tRNA(Gln) amidotransferase subunit GatA [Holosporales bacterium]
MSELTALSLSAAAAGIRAKKFSSVELVDAHLSAITAQNPALNAFITVTAEAAQHAAKAYDAKPTPDALLPGLPIGMKDLFCTKGVRTTAASKILGNFIPPYESTVSANLAAAGAITLGKLNLDEFAMGSANITSAYGVVKNPLKANDDTALCRVPGGSSGGSASAVKAGLCLAATGTDTGGSIRQPAAFCGIVGLKPTYGRCSRWGIIAFASSLDQAGPMTRTVTDAALMLRAMAGFDPKDSTSVDTPVPDYTAAIGQSIKGKRIGLPKEYRLDGTAPAVLAMWDKAAQALREAGAELVEVSLPHTAYALPTYYIIAPAEASSNLARYDGVRFGARVDGDTLDHLYENTRAAGFGAEVQRRILIGTYVLSAGYYDAYYLKAQKVRALIARDFSEAFKSVDALLTPTAPTEAFRLGEEPKDPVAMYLNDVFTIPASLAGVPALALPGGYADNGLPLGVQLIGNHWQEETLLSIGAVLEQAL